jgi:hypothetical protein
LFGADDQKLADFFKVDQSTITRWKQQHKEFCTSLKSGKDEFDTKNVEGSLLKRALGYECMETTYERIELNKEVSQTIGNDYGTKVKTVVKQLPPDPTSMIFWLKNRNKDRWRDKQQHEISGPNDEPREFTNLEVAHRLIYLIQVATERKKQRDALTGKPPSEETPLKSFP